MGRHKPYSPPSSEVVNRSPHATGFSNPVKYILLGPASGVLVGLIHEVISALCWHYDGQPDLWFTGWDTGRASVVDSIILLSVGGGIFGLSYGAVLLRLEKMAKRSIKVIDSLFFLVLITVVTTLPLAIMDLAKERLSLRLHAIYITVILGALFSLAGARRMKDLDC